MQHLPQPGLIQELESQIEFGVHDHQEGIGVKRLFRSLVAGAVFSVVFSILGITINLGIMFVHGIHLNSDAVFIALNHGLKMGWTSGCVATVFTFAGSLRTFTPGEGDRCLINPEETSAKQSTEKR